MLVEIFVALVMLLRLFFIKFVIYNLIYVISM